MIYETPEDVLEHFGVKGMQWGVRNEANKTKQAKRDAKAQKYLDKAADLQRQIDSVKYPYQRINLTKKRNQALKDAEAKRQGKLTDKEKKIAIGAGVAAAVLTAYGTYNAVQSGRARAMAVKGKAFLSGKDKIPWKTNAELARKDLSPREIMDKVVSPINPRYGDIGTKNNCRRATYAYEMRRRGNDVRATLTTNARGQDIGGTFNALNPDQKDFVGSGRKAMLYQVGKERFKERIGLATTSPFTNELKDAGERGSYLGKNLISGDVFDVLKSQPNGSRGELGMQFLWGGGHSMSYEIINNVPHVFDNQTGKVYTAASREFAEIQSGFMQAAFTRLDNVPLNENFLLRWLKDA